MDELIKKHLQDILTAIEEVESFFGNAPKVYDDFYSNLCLRRAVERNIEIIGAAMNRILKVDKDIAITNSRKIVDARNYIIHGYDSLSNSITKYIRFVTYSRPFIQSREIYNLERSLKHFNINL